MEMVFLEDGLAKIQENNMKPSEFKRMIQEAVRYELKEILPEILDEYFIKNFSKTSAPVEDEPEPQLSRRAHEEILREMEMAKKKPAVPQRIIPKAPKVGPKVEKPDFKTYTKNPVLNEILNATKGGVPQENSPYMGMGGSPYSSLMEEQAPADMSEYVDSGEEPESPVAQLLNKNFGAILKASQEKSKQRHG